MAKASVIIPTRGRDACLRQTLLDLSAQSTDDFDLWVVDQNDVHLSGLENSFPAGRLHHEKVKPLGSHGGRNYAIYRTQNPICIFVDDDVRLEKDFIEKHLKAHAGNDPSVAVIAGRVVQPKDNLNEDQMRSNGQLARYSHFTGSVSGNFIGFEKGFVDHIHECNFSARTDVLKSAGAFNEAFEGNAYFEGTDLSLRIISDGFKILYDPNIVLVHLQDSAGGNRVNEKANHTYWMMRNQSLLNSIHMNKIGIPLFELKSLSYVLLKSLKNADAQIALSGLRGIGDGLKYFLPGSKRFKSSQEK